MLECTIHTFCPCKEPSNWFTVVPLISPSVGVTVKDNLSHTLMGLEYVKMYSLASPHTESRTVESRVVLVMSTQYSVRGRAFHITVMVFGAVRTLVIIVPTGKYLKTLYTHNYSY